MQADPIIWLAAIAVVVMVRDAMHDVRHEPPRGRAQVGADDRLIKKGNMPRPRARQHRQRKRCPGPKRRGR